MNSPHSSNMESEKDLVNHICRRYGLDANLAERIHEDIMMAYELTLEEWIRSRHIQLQKRGLKNSEIYSILMEELKKRRFAAEPLSLRQIRRLIYG